MLDQKYLLDFEKPLAELYKKVDELKKLASGKSSELNERFFQGFRQFRLFMYHGT